ncbi:hypothetical protein [Microtetraspora fusca]|uniref:hypothetical protein n=1 Tax=Microtetraspora fusca TaxID=1997 RepID=UPI000AE6D4ED|nr:hypothetical protein [Microtetraspora fusca]
MTATVGGRTIAVGSPTRLLGDSDGNPAAVVAAQVENDGCTAVVVIRDGTPVGVLGVADRLRDEAATTVTALSSPVMRDPPSSSVSTGCACCAMPPGAAPGAPCGGRPRLARERDSDTLAVR